MAANALCVSSKFDIFADRPVQTSTFITPEIACKPITSVDQSVLDFVIPADNEKYIDLSWQIFVKGQLFGADVAELDKNDSTAGVKISYIPYSFSAISV
jgi:hypothetical protein